MIEQLPALPAGVLGFRMRGVVTADDYESVMVPDIEAAFALNRKLRIVVHIGDDFTGFAPGAIDKLFDAFYTTKAHGMGVGLAISRSIIKNHKGELWAQANEGPGATFLFSIPRAAAQAAGMAVGAES